MKYEINYTETLHHVSYVDAANLEEARAKFNRQVDAGEIDFSRGEVTDTEVRVTGGYEFIKDKLDARKNGTPMSLEEANYILEGSTISIHRDGEKYMWFAIMSERSGFNTPRGALNDAMEYYKNGGY